MPKNKTIKKRQKKQNAHKQMNQQAHQTTHLSVCSLFYGLFSNIVLLQTVDVLRNALPFICRFHFLVHSITFTRCYCCAGFSCGQVDICRSSRCRRRLDLQPGIVIILNSVMFYVLHCKNAACSRHRSLSLSLFLSVFFYISCHRDVMCMLCIRKFCFRRVLTFRRSLIFETVFTIE